MGGLAALARADGHEVTGSDENVYPPMSTQLESLGIGLMTGYDPSHLEPRPDLVLVGNALSRGNPAVEHMLNEGIPFTSGPRWLGENYLAERTVIGVAGTHGKTTTSSMLAWILESAGQNPGFLIGGIPGNFGVSARAGGSVFVVEADEYDTAFFDKRAKFVHYRPRIAILGNLEYDHADIYPDLKSIQVQFHHLVRTIPGQGQIIHNAADSRLGELLEMGSWSRLAGFDLHGQSDAPWQVELVERSGSKLRFHHEGRVLGELEWALTGQHNALNALAAMIAADAVGVEPDRSLEALAGFKGVKRRMELLTEANNIRVYDDFAHHPTAIRLTLEGLRRSVGGARILVALEPASNTMRSSVHVRELSNAMVAADKVWLKTSEDMAWDPHEVFQSLDGAGKARARVDKLLDDLASEARPGDVVVFMSNRGFESAPRRFVERLHGKSAS